MRNFGNYMLKGFEINEKIEVYYKCLDDDDRGWTVAEEDNMRKYGMYTAVDDQIDKIKDNKLENPKNHLQGIHSYDILRN